MDLRILQEKIGHRFTETALLAEACRHSSYVNEHPGPDLRDNERLEFLGDAVLGLVVGTLLMGRFPDTPEGDLSRMRANLVNERQLAAIARTLDLGGHLALGRGEIQTNGREKNSILADAFEAVIAAVYLDGGFDAAFRFVQDHYDPLIRSETGAIGDFDYKSRLQEIIQMAHKPMPVYTVVAESGPDHDKTFVVRIDLSDLSTEGTGKSKKTAEQAAAARALEILHGR